MRLYCNSFYLLALSLSMLLLSSCATPVQHSLEDNRPTREYVVTGESHIRSNAPVFIIENPENNYNLIGTPVVKLHGDKDYEVYIDTDTATYYAETRTWNGIRGNYTNLIYRVHFPEIPFKFFPFHLGAGKNIGLFVIITLNEDNQPLLITTLHTCGCYLAFIPTDLLAPIYHPPNRTDSQQLVFGEYLPTSIVAPSTHAPGKLTIRLRNETHRVMDVNYRSAHINGTHQTQSKLLPLEDLQNLPSPSSQTYSLFNTKDPGKEYVKGSYKIWERALMSWWALDWRVGEDKRLGRSVNDGVVFYTSIKPWAREASDLRDFSRFLKYWGWNL